VAAALPVVAAPAEGALGLSYGITVGFLLTLTLALTGWAAASRRVAATGAALATASLTLAWAIAAPLPTLVVLGCLSAGFAACAWRARLAAVRAGGAAASVLSASAFAGCSVLAAGPSASLAAWLPGLAVLGAAGAAQLAAAAVVRSRPLVSLAVEISGWLAALAGAASTFGSPGAASIGLAVAGVLCLGVAARPDRRPLLWAGLAQLEAALCVRLAEAGVHAPEPYAVPASAIAIAAGWYCSRRWPQAASLATYGPGLALLLLPGLVAAGQGSGLGPAAGARPCGGRGDAGGRPGTAGCAVAARGWGGGPGRRA